MHACMHACMHAHLEGGSTGYVESLRTASLILARGSICVATRTCQIRGAGRVEEEEDDDDEETDGDGFAE